MNRRTWGELGAVAAAVLAMPLLLPVSQRCALPAASPTAASAPAAPGPGALVHAEDASALIVDILLHADGRVLIGVQHLRGSETGKTIYRADCAARVLEDLRTGRRRSWADQESLWAILGGAACAPGQARRFPAPRAPSQAEARPRAAVGQTGEHMKRIVDGKSYDTETASLVCELDCRANFGDFAWHDTSLYCSPRGRFFTAGEGGAMSMWAQPAQGGGRGGGSGIRPVDEAEARSIMEANGCSADEFAAVGLNVAEG